MDYEPLISVLTPEGVELSYPLAGVGSRLAARLIDLAVWVALAIPIVVILAVVDAGAIAITTIAVLAGFSLLFGYDVLFEVYGGGRTPGKRAIGLRVLELDGRPVGWRGSAVRSALWWVDGPISGLLVFLVAVSVTRQAQRLGDLAGGTVVVRERVHVQVAGPLPRFTLAPDTVLDTSAIGTAEVAAVADFLARRETLLPQARRTLAQSLADGLRARVPGRVEESATAETFLEQFVASHGARD